MPIDWSNWYDTVNRIKRNPENLYSYNILSVPLKSTVKIFSPTSHIFKNIRYPLLINNAKQSYEYPGHNPSDKDLTFTYIYNGDLRYTSIPYMNEIYSIENMYASLPQSR